MISSAELKLYFLVIFSQGKNGMHAHVGHMHICNHYDIPIKSSFFF